MRDKENMGKRLGESAKGITAGKVNTLRLKSKFSVFTE